MKLNQLEEGEGGSLRIFLVYRKGGECTHSFFIYERERERFIFSDAMSNNSLLTKHERHYCTVIISSYNAC